MGKMIDAKGLIEHMKWQQKQCLEFPQSTTPELAAYMKIYEHSL